MKTTFAPDSGEAFERIRKENEDLALDAEIRQKPNYYSIMPANVRYDKKLSWFDKIIYSEIVALSNKEGHCYANNSYFAKNFEISISTVSRSVSKLNNEGHIYLLFEAVGEKTYRKIYLEDAAKKQVPLVVSAQTPTQKRLPPLRKNDQHNSTSNNTKDNTINQEVSNLSKFLDTWLDIESTGKKISSHVRLGKLYELLWENTYGVPHTLFLGGKNGTIFKSLLGKESELMVVLIMIVHFEWRGMNGNDERIYKRMKDAAFPLPWMANNSETYKTFIVGNMKLDTQEKQVKQVKNSLELLIKNRKK